VLIVGAVEAMGPCRHGRQNHDRQVLMKASVAPGVELLLFDLSGMAGHAILQCSNLRPSLT